MEKNKSVLIVINSRAEFSGLLTLASNLGKQYSVHIFLPELDYDKEIKETLSTYSINLGSVVDKNFLNFKDNHLVVSKYKYEFYSLKFYNTVRAFLSMFRNGFFKTLQLLFLLIPYALIRILDIAFDIVSGILIRIIKRKIEKTKKLEKLAKSIRDKFKTKETIKNKAALHLEGMKRLKFNKLLDFDTLLASFSILYTLMLVETYLKVSKLMKELDPQIVIGGEGSAPYKIKHIVRFFRNSKIKVVVLPYTIANWREYYEAYKDEPSYQVNNFIGRLIYRYDRDLISTMGEKWVSRIPVYFYFGYKVLGIVPKPAWVMNSLALDKVIVDSTFIKDYLTKEGLPKRRIKILGSCDLDQLFINKSEKESRLSNIFESTNETNKGKLILCCPPPYQGGREVVDFKDYQDFLYSFLKDIKKVFSDWNLVVRLHPRLTPNERETIEKNFGIISSKYDTAWLIPLADLYITSVSATIRWALASGVPVVNHDVYNYQYDDFNRSKSLIYTKYYNDFLKVIKNLASPKSGLLEQTRSLAVSDSSYWGVVDGKGAERLNQFIDSAVE